jgi:hypothetical protein
MTDKTVVAVRRDRAFIDDKDRNLMPTNGSLFFLTSPFIRTLPRVGRAS